MSENDTQVGTCSHCAAGVQGEESESTQRTFAIGIISGLLLTVGLVLEFVSSQEIFSSISRESLAHLLFVVVIVVAGYRIFRNAFSALLQRRVEMNLLMSIAAIGAFLIGHAEEGASVIFLFFIAESLEDYSVQRARNSVTGLLKLAPEEAFVKRNGNEVRMHVHDILIGETILVKPGGKVPLDGVVTDGDSSARKSQCWHSDGSDWK
jgi:Cd2+/Zn2+-exporting ATPase